MSIGSEVPGSVRKRIGKSVSSDGGVTEVGKSRWARMGVDPFRVTGSLHAWRLVSRSLGAFAQVAGKRRIAMQRKVHEPVAKIRRRTPVILLRSAPAK